MYTLLRTYAKQLPVRHEQHMFTMGHLHGLVVDAIALKSDPVRHIVIRCSLGQNETMGYLTDIGRRYAKFGGHLTCLCFISHLKELILAQFSCPTPCLAFLRGGLTWGFFLGALYCSFKELFSWLGPGSCSEERYSN